jgi:hypothetical protein
MKVTNWKRKIAASLVAAGLWVPSAYAIDIPLADPSFEAFAIPAGPVGGQYAYANAYRPNGSPWIDDQDHNAAPYFQDTNPSSWLYTTAYANKPGGAKRGSPRTGNQAMHGRFHYSTQEVSNVFEAGKTYTFSIYAQGDDNSVNAEFPPMSGQFTWNSRVFLYLFDGSKPFSEANSLIFQRFSPPGDSFNRNDFVNRDPTWTEAQSQAGWRQISLSWTVQPGAPEIGKNIGVGFWAGDDACLDDASLSVVPEPSTCLLVGAGGISLLAWRRRRQH